MSDFRIALKATLMAKELQTEIDRVAANRTLKINKFTLRVPQLQEALDKASRARILKISRYSLDTKGLSESIQNALNKKSFTLKLTKVDVNTLSETITGQLKSAEQHFESAGDSAGKRYSKSLVDRINRQLETGGFEASLDRVTEKYNKLFVNGSDHSKMHNQLEVVNGDLTKLNSLLRKMGDTEDVEEQVESYKEFSKTLETVRNKLTSVSAQSKTYINNLQITNLDNKIVEWMQNNTRAGRDFGEQVDQLRTKLASLSKKGEVTGTEFFPIERQFKEIQAAATAAGQTGLRTIDIFKRGLSTVTNYISASTLIYQVVRGFKEMYQNVYNIDTEMTELKKVTDETTSSYNAFLQRSAVSAKSLGTTISDLVSSSADFARLGYSFADSEELAKVANIYNVVGDEIDGIDTATKSLISTMTAFKDEMSGATTQGEFALSIIDKFNEVGNNFAISSGGIGDALERSASSLAAANNSLDQSIALITAANTVVQNPEVVGRHYADIKNNYIG